MLIAQSGLSDGEMTKLILDKISIWAGVAFKNETLQIFGTRLPKCGGWFG